ncbi:hypothetical protein [Streptomyces sp. NBRC 109706]|uniref:phage tail protein n=1 Tax=Streptomyces sp. NBRC 109706 TaxID=1550035 RepID=UPI0007823F37|nr:hypothetical protein [Streptomyces sp. NBRC 109706]
MVFTLVGNDRLSRVLRGAGQAAVGLHRRLDSMGMGASALTKVAGAGVRATATIGKIGAAAGSAIGPVSGLAATLVQIAPAAGLAATATLMVATAGGALAIGMSGVGDAITNAFATGEGSAEAYAEALAQLTPSARRFVGELRGMKPALDALKESVQEKLFTGMDVALRTAADTTLPIFHNALTNSAGALSLMGRNVLNTATGLGKSGALGTALSHANEGLYNLSGLPATIVQGLVQIGAAAGPSFARLTAAGGDALARLRDRMTAAFESGAMQSAIEGAIDLIRELGVVGGNIGQIIGNIFGAAAVDGGGFVIALQHITGALAEVTASPAVQGGLAAMASVMTQLGVSAAPLLISAVETIGSVFTVLGPPVERLIVALGDALAPVLDQVGGLLVSGAGALGGLLDAVSPLLPGVGLLVSSLGAALGPVLTALGPLLGALAGSLGQIFAALAPVLPSVGQLVASLGSALTPIVAALGPVLASVAGVIGVLAQALTPLLPILGELIASLGPILTPIITAVGTVLGQLAPLITQLATVIGSALQPVLAVLPGVLDPILAAFTELTGVLVPILSELLTALTPSIHSLGVTLADLLVALSPVIEAGIMFLTQVLERSHPILTRIIGLISALATEFSDHLARVVNNVVMPACQMIVSLLKGDFSGAWDAAKQVVSGFVSTAVAMFKGLPGKAWSALASLGSKVADRMVSAGDRMVSAAKTKMATVVWEIRALPGKARSALSNIGTTLVNIGKNLVRGLWSGIQSMGSWIKDRISSWASSVIPGPIKSVLGIFSPSRVMRDQVGRMIPAGIIAGITDGAPAVDRVMRDLVEVPDAAMPAAVGMRRGGAGGGTTVNINVTGALDPTAVAQQIQRILLGLKRNQGVNVTLGTA